jgi:hypothetical protein
LPPTFASLHAAALSERLAGKHSFDHLAKIIAAINMTLDGFCGQTAMIGQQFFTMSQQKNERTMTKTF